VATATEDRLNPLIDVIAVCRLASFVVRFKQI
jgi:hypothetical protein